MRIHLGANYQGWALARELQAWLSSNDHEVLWHAAEEYDFEDDYPHYAVQVAQGVVADEDAGVLSLGISCGASGAAEVIVCNKVNGARAITATENAVVADGRLHADANILTLGAQIIGIEKAKLLVETLLITDFSNLLDDARRIVNTAEFETSSTIEGWTL